MLVKTDMLLTCLLVRPYSVITALEPPKYKFHVHVCLTHKGLLSTKKKKNVFGKFDQYNDTTYG